MRTAAIAILAALCVSCAHLAPKTAAVVRNPLATGYVVTDCDGQSFYVSPELSKELKQYENHN